MKDCHIYVIVVKDDIGTMFKVGIDCYGNFGYTYINAYNTIKYYTTYEEAQESGIKKALEIILEKGEYENN